MEKIIAIDGNSLMYRAYYALPSMATKEGVPTGAVYGFLGMLLKLLDYKPDYMVVAFDMHGPTFRHKRYEDYKAGRKPTPEDLKTQMPMIREMLQKMQIRICECEGYEADDILGTFSRLAKEEGKEALLVTGDRDALQLINENSHVLMTKKGITDTVEFDIPTLFEHYGLSPARMVDLKALMGDSSDNIPGIPGVGEKTALKLLEKYGSLEEVLQNADKEKGALQKKLLEHGELARLSYWLGTIDTHAPLSIGIADCRFDPANMRLAVPYMNSLELRSLTKRLPEGKEGEEQAEEREKFTVSTISVTDRSGLDEMLRALSDAKELAVYLDKELCLSKKPAEQYAVSLEGGTLLDPGLSPEEVFSAIAPLLSDEGVKKAVFDAKSLLHLLAKQGIELRGLAFDGMIADYLLHAIHPAGDLSALCGERLGCEASAAALLELSRTMGAELREKGLEELYREVELPLIRVLFAMEREGFRVDPEMLTSLGEQFGARLSSIEGEIYAQAGESFNILSPKQLGVILFEKLGLPPRKKTKSGYSTDAEVMESLQELHPIVPLIMEYRFLAKLKSTFVDALIEKAAKTKGRIHTTFNQNVTATGRISSTEPNLQNIPVRTELGREIRRAFVASPGNILVGADYSQIELRLLAHMSADESMIRAFREGQDIHTSTAGEVFGVPVSEVSREMRSAAKAVNFGIVYGISSFGLAKNIGVSPKEAGDYIARYFERYPGVKAYMDRSVLEGKEKGYVTTLLGRRRELPELKSSNFNTRSFGERVAMNMPIQGTAADIIKLAMVRVQRELEKAGLKTRLLLQVHDELILDAPEAEAEQAMKLLLQAMQGVMELSVPLVAEGKTGRSWFDTK